MDSYEEKEKAEEVVKILDAALVGEKSGKKGKREKGKSLLILSIH